MAFSFLEYLLSDSSTFKFLYCAKEERDNVTNSFINSKILNQEYLLGN